MCYNTFSRGSEWRKWDLHFHTPSSYDYQNKGLTDEDIINTLVENKIALVAITDHHIIDVERIKNLQKISSGRICILPGIEFRAELGGSEAIHFIGIFPENADLDRIWMKIQVKCNIDPREIKEKESDEWIICDLKETSDLVHELGGIITVHAGKKANSFENIKNTFPFKMAQKRTLLDAGYIDILEMGKEEDQKTYVDKIFPSLKKRPPLIICSDNHNVNKYEVKQNLWIKADPSFEGLKQIIYEPEERVAIQVEMPDQKRDYQIIDKVVFRDNNFQEEEILLNQNLVTIIGGKSTGKSLLLKNIACAVDNEEFCKRNEIAKINSSKNIASFEVHWKDGQISLLGGSANPQKDIIYIPQSYLNRLVDLDGGTSDIDRIIFDILKQDEEVAVLFESLKEKEREIQNLTSAKINQILYLREDFHKLKEEVKKRGDINGIKNEIQKLSKQINDLQKGSSIDEGSFEKYQKANQEISSLEKELASFRQDKDALHSLRDVKFELQESLLSKLNHQSISANIEEEFSKQKNEFLDKWGKFISLEAEGIEKKLLLLETKIKEKKLSIFELAKQVQQHKSLTELIRIKKIEEEKEEEILTYLSKIETTDTDIRKLFQEVGDLIASFHIAQNATAEAILSKYPIADELTFTINSCFSKENFDNQFVDTFFDRRKLSSFDTEQQIGISNFDFQDILTFKNFLAKVLEAAHEQILPLRKNVTIRDLLLKLSNNWFNLKYDVEYDGDKLNDMSPGKKSYVLLRLLVDIDKRNAPILLDQPEDDLDNRSISHELAMFIKDKKKNRQILVATHNPNIVLLSDAEQIIVANQEGKNAKNKTKNFEYVSGGIEHSFDHDEAINEILYNKGIQQHVCDVMEGGSDAFEKRKRKYNFS